MSDPIKVTVTDPTANTQAAVNTGTHVVTIRKRVAHNEAMEGGAS